MTSLILATLTTAILIFLLQRWQNLAWRTKHWQERINDHLPSRRPPIIAAAREWATRRDRKLEARSEHECVTTRSPADRAMLAHLAEDASGLHSFAFTIAPIDLLAQWFLCAITMPQFATTTNLALGAVIGTGLWLATYWCLAFWEDRSTPRRAVRIARRVAFIAFGIAFLGGLVYGAARYATPDLFVDHEGIVLASLVALAELLPVAGGAASFGVAVARRHTERAARLADLLEQHQVLADFLACLDAEKAPAPSTPHLVEDAHA